MEKIINDGVVCCSLTQSRVTFQVVEQVNETSYFLLSLSSYKQSFPVFFLSSEVDKSKKSCYQETGKD